MSSQSPDCASGASVASHRGDGGSRDASGGDAPSAPSPVPSERVAGPVAFQDSAAPKDEGPSDEETTAIAGAADEETGTPAADEEEDAPPATPAASATVMAMLMDLAMSMSGGEGEDKDEGEGEAEDEEESRSGASADEMILALQENDGERRTEAADGSGDGTSAGDSEGKVEEETGFAPGEDTEPLDEGAEGQPEVAGDATNQEASEGKKKKQRKGGLNLPVAKATLSSVLSKALSKRNSSNKKPEQPNEDEQNGSALEGTDTATASVAAKEGGEDSTIAGTYVSTRTNYSILTEYVKKKKKRGKRGSNVPVGKEAEEQPKAAYDNQEASENKKKRGLNLPVSKATLSSALSKALPKRNLSSKNKDPQAPNEDERNGGALEGEGNAAAPVAAKEGGEDRISSGKTSQPNEKERSGGALEGAGAAVASVAAKEGGGDAAEAKEDAKSDEVPNDVDPAEKQKGAMNLSDPFFRVYFKMWLKKAKAKDDVKSYEVLTDTDSAETQDGDGSVTRGAVGVRTDDGSSGTTDDESKELREAEKNTGKPSDLDDGASCASIFTNDTVLTEHASGASDDKDEMASGGKTSKENDEETEFSAHVTFKENYEEISFAEDLGEEGVEVVSLPSWTRGCRAPPQAGCAGELPAMIRKLPSAMAERGTPGRRSPAQAGCARELPAMIRKLPSAMAEYSRPILTDAASYDSTYETLSTLSYDTQDHPACCNDSLAQVIFDHILDNRRNRKAEALLREIGRMEETLRAVDLPDASDKKGHYVRALSRISALNAKVQKKQSTLELKLMELDENSMVGGGSDDDGAD